jgi:predicted transposase YbfD/YdcC
MDAQPTSLLTRMFNDIESIHDPRADNARHFLADILILAMLAVMCGLDDYPGIVEYGRDEHDWLKTFLRLPHGIPSISTFRRVFAALKPAVLLNLMRRWSGELSGVLAGKQVAIDGKTLRRSFEHAWDKSGLHLVTAWCVQENLVLAQQAVDEKSNEITAVPELLKMLDIRGAVVTVDALNTQTQIAAEIVKGGGDYVMAVKDNHPTLCDAVQRNLDEMILEKFAGVDHVYHETTESGHGRIDTRKVWATSQIEWLNRRDEWKKLGSVIAVESIRRMDRGEVKTSRRYYISSLPSESGERLGNLIREHWSIENGQHWTLDMAFNEDQNRVRKDHGDQNLAVLRRIALGLLRRDKSVKLGAKNKRLKAGRNRDYLMRVLLATPEAK